MNQLVRYAIVGAVSNATAYACYLAISFLGAPPVMSMTVVYLVAAAIGFWGNRRLTFDHQGAVLGAAGRYLLAHAVGYLLNLALLVTFVDVLGYPHPLVQAAAILVVAAYLFLAFRFFVFGTTPVADATPDIQAGES